MVGNQHTKTRECQHKVSTYTGSLFSCADYRLQVNSRSGVTLNNAGKYAGKYTNETNLDLKEHEIQISRGLTDNLVI